MVPQNNTFLKRKGLLRGGGIFPFSTLGEMGFVRGKEDILLLSPTLGYSHVKVVVPLRKRDTAIPPRVVYVLWRESVIREKLRFSL